MNLTEKLDQLINGFFDQASDDGLALDVYHKMAIAVAFLLKHYDEIPGDIFRNYLYISMQILNVKNEQSLKKKNEAIPSFLLNDLLIISTS